MKFKVQYGCQEPLYSDALQVRKQVFVDEQAVPLDREIDGLDSKRWQIVGYLEDQPVATARYYLYDHEGRTRLKLERVATLSSHRGQGLGRMLLQSIFQRALDHGAQEIFLSSQIQATGFYEGLGFQRINDEVYLDAGIDHCDMVKDLV